MKKEYIFALLFPLFVFNSCESIRVENNEKNSEGETWQKPISEGMTEEQKLAFAEESLDELINAVKEDDFKKYFRRFIRDSKDLIKESDFKSRNNKFREQCGEYVSREFIGVLKKQLFDVYLWKARYGKLPNDDILLKLFIVEEDGKLGIYAFNVQPF